MNKSTNKHQVCPPASESIGSVLSMEWSLPHVKILLSSEQTPSQEKIKRKECSGAIITASIDVAVTVADATARDVEMSTERALTKAIF